MYPEVFDTETLPDAIVELPEAKVTVGVSIVSLAEKTSVITSDAFASVLVALFEEILTLLSSAEELSNVQLN